MPEPTPGQACYEAYIHAHGDPDWFTPWDQLLRERQARWEAAAQAVLARDRTAPPLSRCEEMSHAK